MFGNELADILEIFLGGNTGMKNSTILVEKRYPITWFVALMTTIIKPVQSYFGRCIGGATKAQFLVNTGCYT